MANTTFQLRRSSVAGKTPNTATLSIGELGINITDQKLFSTDGTNIFETSANLTTLKVANNTVTGITVNSSVLYVNVAIAANGSGNTGTPGHILTTNGSGVYWASAAAAGVDLNAQYTWTNTQTFSNTITFSSVINGTANNANNLGGTAASSYQLNSTLAANVAILTANNANNFGGQSYSTVTGHITSNAATAYTNAVSYTDTKIATVNTAITGNAATAYTNAVSYTDTKIGTANTAITGNAATAYTNAVSYTDGKILTANGAITGNAATAYSNATTFASNADNISSGTLNTARLPATANISTAVNVGANINLTTSSINVGSISIKANSIVIPANASIDFNTTTYKPDFQKGRMYWDNEEQTIIVFGDGSSFEQSMGQREWVRTRNSTASTIPKGTPVYITGVHISGDAVHGHHPTIAPGDASDYDKSQIIGITGEDIAPSSHGYTVVRGYIEGLDTSALTSGQRAHLGFLTPGTIVLNAPEYPNYPTDLGMCLSSNSTVGTFYVDLAMHTAERFRTTADMYVGGKLTVAGDLNVTGNVFATSATNLSVSDNIIYLGGGDTIAPSSITHTGGGLDDMLFHGVFEGTSSTTYYVKITSASGSIDKFTWSKDNFATTSGTANVTITAGTYFPLDNGISIAFNADNGHKLNDIWYATAAPINVDIGLVGNYNDTSYKHTGLFRDATDGVYKFFQGYTPEPDAAVNINTGHASFQFAAVQANTFTGNLIGTANNANNLGGTAASSYQLNSTLSDNVATLTANNTSYVGSVTAANVVSNAQLSGNLSSYQTTAGLSANVATLTANNTSYLGTVAAASFVQNTDSRTLSGNLNFTGTNTYFSAPTTFAANVKIATTAGINANGSYGTANQVLTSNGTSVYWGNVSSATVVRQQYTATGTSNVFTVSSGYTANNLDVYLNGVKLQNGVEVNVSSGTTFTILSGTPASGTIIEVVGTTGGSTITAAQADYTAQYTWTNTHIFSNTVTFNASLLANTINATSFTVGGIVTVNDTIIFIGNNSVNASINTTSLYIGGNVIANSTGANNAFNLNGTPASSYQLNSTLAANVATMTSNNANHLIYANYRSVTANDSIIAGDTLILSNSINPITLTLPSAASTNGSLFQVKNTNTGIVTIVGSGADLIDGYANLVIKYKNSSIGFLSTSTGWIRV